MACIQYSCPQYRRILLSPSLPATHSHARRVSRRNVCSLDHRLPGSQTHRPSHHTRHPPPPVHPGVAPRRCTSFLSSMLNHSRAPTELASPCLQHRRAPTGHTHVAPKHHARTHPLSVWSILHPIAVAHPPARHTPQAPGRRTHPRPLSQCVPAHFLERLVPSSTQPTLPSSSS